MFLDEEFLEFDSECLDESATTSKWFGYFFKGTSDDINKRIKKQVKESVNSKKEAEELLEEIEENIELIHGRGDSSHTGGNIAFALIPGIGLSGLLIKHLIKVYGFKDARKKALKLLQQQRDELIIHMEKKNWR